MTENRQNETKGTTSIYPLFRDMHPLTLTFYGRLLDPSTPLPTSLSNSMVKQPGLEKYRENRESGEMKTLAFLPTPSRDTYNVSSQKEREGVCRRSEEEGRCWPSPSSTWKLKYCTREGIPMAKNHSKKTRSPSTRIFPSIPLIIKGPRSDDLISCVCTLTRHFNPLRSPEGYHRRSWAPQISRRCSTRSSNCTPARRPSGRYPRRSHPGGPWTSCFNLQSGS